VESGAFGCKPSALFLSGEIWDCLARPARWFSPPRIYKGSGELKVLKAIITAGAAARRCCHCLDCAFARALELSGQARAATVFSLSYLRQTVKLA
jgi:hypothetical protein